MSRLRLRSAISSVAVVALAAAVSVGAAGPALSSTAARAKPAMELTGDGAFSPNGDGRHDTARYAVQLRKRAKVSIKVLDGEWNVVRGPVRLGEHRAGSTATWTWNGRGNDGRRVPDHYHYVVKAKAKPYAGKVVTDTVWLAVDTAFSASLQPTFDTLFPRSTVVSDRIRFGTRGYDELDRGTLEIRRAGGRLVFSKTADWSRGYPYGVAFPVGWNGHDDEGDALAAGTYYARVKARDYVGNLGRTKRVSLTVSASRLVEATATVDISPAASRIPYNPCENSTANGCGDYPPCGDVVASETYPAAHELGALSYRSRTGCGRFASQDLAIGWHALPRPADSARGTTLASVSMRGRPTNPGETDVARLGGGNASATSPVTTHESITTVEGTSSVTAQDLVAQLEARWAVSTSGDNWYDAASFRVTYRYLKPVP